MKQQCDRKITIRRAKPGDRDTIVRIQYSALKVLAAKDYNAEQLAALLKSKSTPRDSLETIFVAEIDRQTVGFASLLHPCNTIGAVFVDPNFTRQNIGTQLVKRLEIEAIKRQIPIIWVCSSLTGHNFYLANGYQTISKTSLRLYSTYIPCVQMKKRLLPISTAEILQEICQLLIVIILAIAMIYLFNILLG